MGVTTLSNKFLVLVAGFLAVIFLSPMHASADVDSRYTLCKLGKQVRTLRIDNSLGKCTTKYTKNGIDQTEGEAQNAGACEEVLERIRSHLQEAGWKCREVKDSTASLINDSLVE